MKLNGAKYANLLLQWVTQWFFLKQIWVGSTTLILNFILICWSSQQILLPLFSEIPHLWGLALLALWRCGDSGVLGVCLSWQFCLQQLCGDLCPSCPCWGRLWHLGINFLSFPVRWSQVPPSCFSFRSWLTKRFIFYVLFEYSFSAISFYWKIQFIFEKIVLNSS